VVSEGLRYEIDNFVIAALCGDTESIKIALNRRLRGGEQPLIDINAMHGTLLCTALHVACEYGKLDAVKLLLNHGANINTKCGVKGRSPLHYAASNIRITICEYLVSKGANKRARDHNKQRPCDLVEAVTPEGRDLKEFLLDPPGRIPVVVLRDTTHDSLTLEWDDDGVRKQCSHTDYYTTR